MIRRAGKYEIDVADFDAAMTILKAQGLDKNDEDTLYARHALRNRIIAVADGIKDEKRRTIARNRICTSQAARPKPVNQAFTYPLRRKVRELFTL